MVGGGREKEARLCTGQFHHTQNCKHGALSLLHCLGAQGKNGEKEVPLHSRLMGEEGCWEAAEREAGRRRRLGSGRAPRDPSIPPAAPKAVLGPGVSGPACLGAPETSAPALSEGLFLSITMNDIFTAKSVKYILLFEGLCLYILTASVGRRLATSGISF